MRKETFKEILSICMYLLNSALCYASRLWSTLAQDNGLLSQVRSDSLGLKDVVTNIYA